MLLSSFSRLHRPFINTTSSTVCLFQNQHVKYCLSTSKYFHFYKRRPNKSLDGDRDLDLDLGYISRRYHTTLKCNLYHRVEPQPGQIRSQNFNHKNSNDKRHHHSSSDYKSLVAGSSFSCLSLALFCIYYFWNEKKSQCKSSFSSSYNSSRSSFSKNCPWLNIAECQSQENERESVRLGKWKTEEVRSRKFDFKHADVGEVFNNKANSPKEVVSNRVDESDTLSFKEAVKKAEDLLKKRMMKSGSPGIVVCVSVDGKYVYAKGFGDADVENKLPIHPHSILRIASISKSMTAAIIGKLLDEGKLDLDKSVYHYLPNFPSKDYHGEKVDFTIRQLLNHTAGIRGYWLPNDPVKTLQPQMDKMMSAFDKGTIQLFYTLVKENGSKSKCTDDNKTDATNNTDSWRIPAESYYTVVFSSTTEALKLFANDRLMAKPDSKYIYSTLGYTVLAAVIEAVMKKSFETIAKETFQLWGLKETYLDQHNPLIYNRARHYQRRGGILVNTPYVDSSYKWAGGGFLSSVMDVIKFGNLLLYSYQHADKDPGRPGYLKQSSVKELWNLTGKKNVNEKYALGFELALGKDSYGMCPNHSFGAGHTGGAVGASSALFILPRTRQHSKGSTAVKVCGSGKNMDQGEMNNPQSHKEAQETQAVGESSSLLQNPMPQGVCVAVIVNLTGIHVRDVAEEIARTFERVVFE